MFHVLYVIANNKKKHVTSVKERIGPDTRGANCRCFHSDNDIVLLSELEM